MTIKKSTNSKNQVFSRPYSKKQVFPKPNTLTITNLQYKLNIYPPEKLKNRI